MSFLKKIGKSGDATQPPSTEGNAPKAAVGPPQPARPQGFAAKVERKDPLKQRSHVQALQESSSNLMYLSRGYIPMPDSTGKTVNRPVWYYVLVDKVKKPLFLKVYAEKTGETIDIADYGKVVESGWGEDPPAEITRRIQAQYGGGDPDATGGNS